MCLCVRLYLSVSIFVFLTHFKLPCLYTKLNILI